ncbi:glycosyltransferase family 22 protein [Hyaloscypha variabilis]
MKGIDTLLNLLIPTLIILHLLVAPYTKVEESFNIQAAHDIATYGIPIWSIGNVTRIATSLQENYDHFSFPGAVPRTFAGALALAQISRPILAVTGGRYGQYIVRATLGLFNAAALLLFRTRLDKAFGKDVGRWYILLQAAQFHVIYYASRTLPNMFAFGFTTLALRAFVTDIQVQGSNAQRRREQRAELERRQKWGIFLFVFAGVVFRSEIALLLFTQLVVLFFRNRIWSLQTVIMQGLTSASFSVWFTFLIDSFFWWKPIWPELAGFYFNAIQGKSADWGTSPFGYYFSTILPRLLLNPLILMVLIPMGLMLPATRNHTRDLTLPSVSFIAIYSLQPHKEARFIIYVIPPLTAAAALGASYIWTRRTKSLLYRLGSLMLVGSVLLSFVASTAMLLISSLNYPGGQALSQFHDIISHTTWPSEASTPYETISVHMDVLSCMTGVTRFQELPSGNIPLSKLPVINNRTVQLFYDKTEDEKKLLNPAFWQKFDYALMEAPEQAIGKWEVVGTVFAYAGLELLRPGDGSSFGENLERVYEANQVTKMVDGEEKAPESSDVVHELEEGNPGARSSDDEERRAKEDLKAKLLLEEMAKFGTFNLVRDAVRGVTGGWWIGPRMEPRIRILKRVKEPFPL